MKASDASLYGRRSTASAVIADKADPRYRDGDKLPPNDVDCKVMADAIDLAAITGNRRRRGAGIVGCMIAPPGAEQYPRIVARRPAVGLSPPADRDAGSGRQAELLPQRLVEQPRGHEATQQADLPRDLADGVTLARLCDRGGQTYGVRHVVGGVGGELGLGIEVVHPGAACRVCRQLCIRFERAMVERALDGARFDQGHAHVERPDFVVERFRISFECVFACCIVRICLLHNALNMVRERNRVPS